MRASRSPPRATSNSRNCERVAPARRDRVEERDAATEPVSHARILPDAFYSTTNLPTQVRVDGRWSALRTSRWTSLSSSIAWRERRGLSNACCSDGRCGGCRLRGHSRRAARASAAPVVRSSALCRARSPRSAPRRWRFTSGPGYACGEEPWRQDPFRARPGGGAYGGARVMSRS